MSNRPPIHRRAEYLIRQESADKGKSADEVDAEIARIEQIVLAMRDATGREFSLIVGEDGNLAATVSHE